MEIIKTYFPEFTDNQIDDLTNYANLLLDWNQKINLISRKDEEKVIEHHILHALSIVTFIEFNEEADILDLGTGGGLPGIPLAIAFPKSNFLLVDSIGKKIRAVQEIVEKMGLKNVKSKHERAENLQQKFDFIVTRAVAKTPTLLQWTKKLYKKENNHELPNGLLALKGGDLESELETIKKDYELVDLSDFYEIEFFETKKLLYLIN